MITYLPQASFTISKNSLTSLLKQMKVSSTAGKSRKPVCELTLADNKATFVAPGATVSMPIIFKGAAKASFDLNVFIKLIKTFPNADLQIEIHPNHVWLENFKLPASVTFIEDDKILRSIDLPINYTEFDLLVISRNERFTKDEIEFNQLTVDIADAEKSFENILKIMDKRLVRFGITKQDIRDLLELKIQKRLSQGRHEEQD